MVRRVGQDAEDEEEEEEGVGVGGGVQRAALPLLVLTEFIEIWGG